MYLLLHKYFILEYTDLSHMYSSISLWLLAEFNIKKDLFLKNKKTKI